MERKAKKQWNKWNKLLISIVIDLVGLSDFIVPGAAQVHLLQSWMSSAFLLINM